MTEDEAKTKWCPFTRLTTANSDGTNPSPTAYNRIDVRNGRGGQPVGALCIASACMAWRWNHSEENSGFCGMGGSVGASRPYDKDSPF